jgi:O-antigen/teichoic acid export membrane protein
MIKQALRDSVIYALAAVLYRSLVLIQVPLFANTLGPNDFGVVDLTDVVVNLLNITVALEISQAVAIYFAEAKDTATKIRIASTSFWFTAFCYTALTLAIIPMHSGAATLVFENAGSERLLAALLLYAFSNGIFLLSQNLLRWTLRADLFLCTALIHGLVNLGVSLLLVQHFKVGVLGIIYGQILAGILAAAASIYLARQYYAFDIHLPTLKKMLRFSAPLVLGSVSVLASLFIDRFCLREFLGLGAVGTYGIAYRFASLVGIVIIGFSRAFTPLVYNHHDKPETPSQISRAFDIYLLLSGTIIVFLALFSDVIVETFASAAYSEAAELIPLIAISLVLGNIYIFAPGFATSKKTNYIASISIICALINLALNLILIPATGIAGAAYATILSSLLAGALWLFLGQRFYRVPFEIPRLLLFGICLFACLYAAKNLQTMHWASKALSFIVMSALLYAPFRSRFDSISNSIAKRID